MTGSIKLKNQQRQRGINALKNHYKVTTDKELIEALAVENVALKQRIEKLEAK